MTAPHEMDENDFDDSGLPDEGDLDSSGPTADELQSGAHPTNGTSLQAVGNNGIGFFKGYAQQLFPYAQFTGGSSIHASIGRAGIIPVDMGSQANLILKSMVRSEFFQYIQRVMNKHCPGMEWLITPEDFENLLLLDAHRILNGLPTSETKTRLQNPQTGNYFHRVTMMEDKNVVGGIRVWIESRSGGTEVGFRFRLEPIVAEGTESQEEAALRIRQKTAHTIVEVNEEIVEIKEAIEHEVADPVAIPEYIEEPGGF
jgi:hypothetical protein